MLNKLFKALSRSRSTIADAFKSLAGKRITPESLESLEEQLLGADLGFETVESIMGVVERHSKSNFIIHIYMDQFTNQSFIKMIKIIIVQIFKLQNLFQTQFSHYQCFQI